MSQDVIEALQKIADVNQRFYTLVTAELASIKGMVAALSDSQKAFIASELKLDPLQIEQDFRQRINLYESAFLSASNNFLAQAKGEKPELE